MEMEIHLVAPRDADFEMALDGRPARLTGACRIEPVSALVLEA